jgi:hypothetical protein
MNSGQMKTKNLFSKIFIKRFGSLLTNILRQNHSLKMPEDQLVNFIKIINHRLSNNGVNETIKFFKSIHLIATKIAMKRPFEPIPFCKSDKEGVPMVIKPLLPYLRGSTIEKRVALSITKLYLGLNTQPSTDFSSITTGSDPDWSQLGQR